MRFPLAPSRHTRPLLIPGGPRGCRQLATHLEPTNRHSVCLHRIRAPKRRRRRGSDLTTPYPHVSDGCARLHKISVFLNPYYVLRVKKVTMKPRHSTLQSMLSALDLNCLHNIVLSVLVDVSREYCEGKVLLDTLEEVVVAVMWKCKCRRC